MRYPITFENQGQSLFGMVHLPEEEGRFPAVVLLHGFTGTKVEPHRFFVKLAEAFASNGIAALRFDFRGSGDSEGDFSEATVSGEIDDAKQAISFLSNQSWVLPHRIGLLGFSLGGAVAACVSSQNQSVKALALVSPVADLKYLAEAVANGQTGPIDIGGNLIGQAFIDDAQNIEPLAQLKQAPDDVLVVHGTKDSVVPLTQGKAYVNALQLANKRVEFAQIPDADHTYNSHRWECQVIESVTSFFAQTL